MSYSVSEPEQSNEISPFLLAGHLLPKKWAGWATRGVAAYMAAGWVYSKFQEKNQTRYVVLNFCSDENCYNWVLAWMLNHQIENSSDEFDVSHRNRVYSDSTSLILSSSGTEHEILGAKTKPKRTLMTVPKDSMSIIWNGINILVERNSAQINQQNSTYITLKMRDTIKLSIPTRNKDVLDKLLDEIEHVGRTQVESAPSVAGIYIYDYDWSRVKDCPTEEKVILPEGVYHSLKEDLTHFLNNREWYDSVMVPWRRGYLLYGPAGSGKTSTVQTLAGTLGLNVYRLNLADTKAKEFESALSGMRNGILLLEDIDCFFDGRTRTEGLVSFSTVLNELDGICSKEGRVTFVTTNNLEKLDEALIRPGRIDVHEKFGFATYEQIYNLALRFGVDNEVALEYADHWSMKEITMAEVQKRLILWHEEQTKNKQNQNK